jgi:hypothetical protein
MSTRLRDALRQKYRSPREVMLALGLDADLLAGELGLDASIIDDDSNSNGGNQMATRFRTARRLGKDEEEEGRQDLHEMIDDPETSAGEIVAAIIDQCPDEERESLHEVLSEVANDIRSGNSYRAHARDRMVRRRLSKDARLRRRVGGDDPPPFSGMPRTGGEMEPLDRREGEDRRRMAGDMAFDRGTSSLEAFHRRFPMLRGRVPERF